MTKKLVDRWTDQLAEKGWAVVCGKCTESPFGVTEEGFIDLRELPVKGPTRLEGVTLSRVDCSGLQADDRFIFANARLVECRFDRARARWGDYQSTFEKVSYRKAKLANSGFGSPYVRCDFTQADLSGMVGLAPTFTECIFERTKWSRSMIKNCSFIECKFSGKIEGVMFGVESGLMRRCDLRESTFIDCTFNGFRFENCTVSEDVLVFTDWPAALKRLAARLAKESNRKLVEVGENWLGVWNERLEVSHDELVDRAELVDCEGPAIGNELFRVLKSIQK